MGPGVLTFPLLLQHVDDMVTVSDADLVQAVRFAMLRLKLVIEPSGALGLAAMMSAKAGVTGRVGIIISGGNVDAEMLRWILLDDAVRPPVPPEP
jgi:threonine dehydratase